MSRGTLRVVQSESGDPREGPGRFEGPSGMSGTGWGCTVRVGKPSGRFRTGRETLGEVRVGWGTLGEVHEGLGNRRVGPGRIGGQ